MSKYICYKETKEEFNDFMIEHREQLSTGFSGKASLKRFRCTVTSAELIV
jgi:hypothetical protein